MEVLVMCKKVSLDCLTEKSKKKIKDYLETTKKN
jgi:hypothetical protein